MKEKNVAEMLRLREEGLSYQQIADIYGVTRQCVHQRIQRARTQVEHDMKKVVYKQLKADSKKADRLFNSYEKLKVSGISFDDFCKIYNLCESRVSSPLTVSKRVAKYFGKNVGTLEDKVILERILQEYAWLTLEQGARRARREQEKERKINSVKNKTVQE